MGPVETYLAEMRELHSARAGVKETTYYTALANLLDAVGKTLKPWTPITKPSSAKPTFDSPSHCANKKIIRRHLFNALTKY